MTTAPAPARTGYNSLHPVRYRGGWIGLFAGENQTKALGAVLLDLNSHALKVAAIVEDRWSFWRRLGNVLLAVVTLGFVVRVPNVLVISEPWPT